MTHIEMTIATLNQIADELENRARRIVNDRWLPIVDWGEPRHEDSEDMVGTMVFKDMQTDKLYGIAYEFFYFDNQFFWNDRLTRGFTNQRLHENDEHNEIVPCEEVVKQQINEYEEDWVPVEDPKRGR